MSCQFRNGLGQDGGCFRTTREPHPFPDPSPSKQSIRILAVAPTRALVNDLHARLERPLFELGLSCGRQTSDHREKHQAPEVLITTPESFDSMLVRDGVRKKGELTLTS